VWVPIATIKSSAATRSPTPPRGPNIKGIASCGPPYQDQDTPAVDRSRAPSRHRAMSSLRDSRRHAWPTRLAPSVPHASCASFERYAARRYMSKARQQPPRNLFEGFVRSHLRSESTIASHMNDEARHERHEALKRRRLRAFHTKATTASQRAQSRA
jgi:hypothetical protein